MPPGELRERFEAFSPGFLAGLGLTHDGQPASFKVTAVDIPAVGDLELARESSIGLSGRIPAETKAVGWAFPEKYGSSVLRIERPGQEVQAQFFLAGATNDSVLDLRSGVQRFLDYALVGFVHILPKGLDHILFVLGLFLLSQKLRPLLVQVTAFTVAHSITLALGLYGFITISPAIVEPLIALSIVYVAVENILTDRLHLWRPAIVFLFGLLHGLGFAGILTDSQLPQSDFVLGLVAFNVGVEFGQLTVIALAFLLVYKFMSEAWYRQRIVIPASLAIAGMGAYWFVERTFL